MMIPEQEAERLEDTLVVSGRCISCDGGDQATGHPKVWYDLGDGGEAICKYCGRRFVYRPE